MEVVNYQGEIWQGAGVHPQLWHLLRQKDLLIEITHGSPPFQVVLGVPHHGAQKVEQIAELWVNPRTGALGRTPDEEAGLFGLAAFSALRDHEISCKLVIVAHPTDHDPNKMPGCAYWQSIFAAPAPALLFELHGAAHHRRHMLELSAGSNHITDPLRVGRVLAYYLDLDGSLAVQVTPGNSAARIFKSLQETGGRLQNPAIETLSISQASQMNIPALHLEMKPIFRLPDPAYPYAPQPSAPAWQLARAIASTLELLAQSNDIHISAAETGLPSSAFLTRPALPYESSYLQAVRVTDLQELNDNPDLRIWTHEDFVNLVEGAREVIVSGLPQHPPEEYLWLIDQREFIGRVFFLHWLNEFRLKTDGQVDYWIRPDKRRQGYGTLILRLLLERFRQLHMQDRILISCLSSNLPSQKIIEANGGIFESEIKTRDSFGFPRPRRRYWISL